MGVIPGFGAGFICTHKQASQILCSEDEFHCNGASASFKNFIIAIPACSKLEDNKRIRWPVQIGLGDGRICICI